MANWLKSFIFRRYRDGAIKRHELNYLFWECTLRCNLDCLHCGSDCLKESGKEEMSVEDFAKVLDDIKENNTAKKLAVCITGGEPLLRKDLEQAGREVVKRGFQWGIVTNGMLLTRERFISLLDAGMTSMSFSFDGVGELHNYLRQNKNAFEKVVHGIDMALAVQKKNPRRLVFDVITCVHRGNLDHLGEIRDWLIERGVRMWRIFSIFPEGRAAQNDLSLTNAEYRKLMDFIADTRKNYGSQINLNYACEGYLGKYELKVRDYFFFCRGGVNVGSVWCDGSVGACLSVRSPDLIQGNVYKDSFMHIWNTKFQDARDRSWAKKHCCAKCKKWKNCLGNGLHLYHSKESEVAHCNYRALLEE